MHPQLHPAWASPDDWHSFGREVLAIATQWRFGAALVALTALWLAMLLWGAGPLDRAVYLTLYAGQHPLLLTIAHVVTWLGDPDVLIGASLIVAVLLYRAGHRRLPWVFAGIMLVGRGLVEAQKFSVGRPRPDVEAHLVIVKTPSFPSGHAANSMIFYLTLAMVMTMGSRWHRPAALGAVALSLLIGISRVMLGVHWPSDVIGGWVFGVLWVMLTLRLARRLVQD